LPEGGQPPAAPARVRPRDAASLILWRDGPSGAEVLMGNRHASHRFMPGVLVFPGGRVDPTDHRHPSVSELAPETRTLLERRGGPGRARALGVAAVRELHEETGLVLGAHRGGALLPDLAALHYICRAITPPPGRIRFHARFLAAPADTAHGEITGSGELEHLRFWPVAEALAARIAGITAKVMGAFTEWLALHPKERHGHARIMFRGIDTPVRER
jgi:8-oxo-dGTP pyrophosphatase MutT (NUDIX family)